MGFRIVIPSKNANNIRECIKAIAENELAPKITVVDDGIDWSLLRPQEGETQGVVYNMPWRDGRYEFTRIPGIKPFCFARNVNLAIDYHSEDDILILNDDAILKTMDGFANLARQAKEHPEYGIIGSAANNVGNVNQNRRGGNGVRRDPRMVCFVCTYIPRSTINKVGTLDERFIHYGMDDDDYSLRVRLAGLQIGISEECFVDHHTLESSYRAPSPINNSPGDFLPNMALYIQKWGLDNRGHGRFTSPFAKQFPAGEWPCEHCDGTGRGGRYTGVSAAGVDVCKICQGKGKFA